MDLLIVAKLGFWRSNWSQEKADLVLFVVVFTFLFLLDKNKALITQRKQNSIDA